MFADVSTHKKTGVVRHFDKYGPQHEFSHIAICSYGNENEIYLFHCNADWETQNDDEYDSIQAALEWAMKQYAGLELSSFVQCNEANNWKMIKTNLPVGAKFACTVLHQAHFGVLVEVANVPFIGVIPITEIRDAPGPFDGNLPAVGTELTAVLLGFKEGGHQLWLGTKESQLKEAVEE